MYDHRNQYSYYTPKELPELPLNPHSQSHLPGNPVITSRGTSNRLVLLLMQKANQRQQKRRRGLSGGAAHHPYGNLPINLLHHGWIMMEMFLRNLYRIYLMRNSNKSTRLQNHFPVSTIHIQIIFLFLCNLRVSTICCKSHLRTTSFAPLVSLTSSPFAAFLTLVARSTPSH